MRRDDEDDRAGGESWIDHVVIPDDISALDAEVRALRRERRARARRDRLRRLVSPRGPAGPLVIVALLMVAGFASLLLLFQPRRPTTSPAPLASSGAGSDRDGQLLPDLPVTQADGTPARVRDFRPAVLALAPIGCGCDAALRDVGLVVVQHGVYFLLVDRTLPALPAGLTGSGTVRLAEPTGVLATKYGAERAGRRTPGGPVLVLVGVDGRFVRKMDEPIALRKLKTELDVLRLGLGTRAPTG
ncbi:MAG: hypothetical protein ACJ73E_03855 [Mycobacteriales bacterium]